MHFLLWCYFIHITDNIDRTETIVDEWLDVTEGDEGDTERVEGGTEGDEGGTERDEGDKEGNEGDREYDNEFDKEEDIVLNVCL